jgi:hypothetical protein
MIKMKKIIKKYKKKKLTLKKFKVHLRIHKGIQNLNGEQQKMEYIKYQQY